jgi:hypothetical protein
MVIHISPLMPPYILHLRSRFHAAFDPIWMEGHMHRNYAYHVLAMRLNKHERETEAKAETIKNAASRGGD